MPKRAIVKVAEPAILNRVYRALLDCLSLSPEHQQHLISPMRQLTLDQIKRHGYKSLPSRERSQIAQKLLREFDLETLLLVPGFYWSKRGRSNGYLTLAGAAGILCPFMDTHGQIQGFQIKDLDRSGYTWLSSTKVAPDRIKGPGPGDLPRYLAHVARPDEVHEQRVWITEGPLKADIAADLLSAVVIGLPGVSTWEACRVVDLLAELEADDVVVAYDADKRENTQVKSAEKNLVGALLAAGLRVELAQWDLDAGKGIDDLLLNDGTPTLSPWCEAGETKRLITVPGAAIEALKAEFPVTSTLEEARKDHYEAASAVLTGEDTRPLFLASGTGTGKTRATFDALCDQFKSGSWPKEYRVLFVTDTKAQIEGIRTDPAFAWLKYWEDLGQVVIRTGRDEQTCHPGQIEQVQALGARRHPVKREVCDDCPFKDECVYNKAIDQARKARLTLATKDAIFHNPDLLQQYGTVIVDEELVTRCLFDLSATLRSEDGREWLDGMDRLRSQTGAYDDTHPVRCVVNWLSSALYQAPPNNMRPLLPVLREIAGGRNALSDGIRQARLYQPEKGQPFDFERRAGVTIPLRLLGDLLNRLAIEHARDDNADTSLWLGRGKIQLYAFREKALQILRHRRFIALDATTPPMVLDAFENARILRHRVPEQILVTQITDDLLTKRTLDRPEKRAQIRRALERIAEGARQPAFFVPKGLNPDVGGSEDLAVPGAIYGHYGRDNRALNDEGFMQADVLALVGVHFHPPDHMVAIVQAIRDRGDAPDATDSPNYNYKPYQHLDAEGRGRAHRIRAHSDPDVQQAIDHQASAELLQAIGRARAALRDDLPLHVYVLTAYPITGLKVDKLTTLKALAGDKGGAPAPLVALNNQRAAVAEDRYQDAIAQLTARGEKVTVRAVLALAGGSATTASKAIKKWQESVSMGCVTHTRFNNYSVTLPVCNKAGRKTPERVGMSLYTNKRLTCGVLPYGCCNGAELASAKPQLKRGPALPKAYREDYDERAAIMEYDGELDRAHAEKEALSIIERQRHHDG